MAPLRRPFFALSRETAREWVAATGASPVWADRLRAHLLQGGRPETLASAPGRHVPQGLLAALEEKVLWSSSHVLERHPAPDGVEKILLSLADGEAIEAVRLPGKEVGSACVSSQVGCAMACRFCASGLEGASRNLHAHEILEQVMHLRQGGSVERLVFMGSGEPTANMAALETVLPILRDEAGIGPRHVLVSTVGPPAAVDRLADLNMKFTLALSLHAVDPALRGDLIPTQAHVVPQDLLDAACRFYAQTGRPYQVEWVLMGGVNDSEEHARELAKAMQGRRGHISVIVWNVVPGMPFQAPIPGRAEAFVESLRGAGCSAVLRRTVGAPATAACGQLRAARVPKIGYV